jgi:hypothetical protein
MSFSSGLEWGFYNRTDVSIVQMRLPGPLGEGSLGTGVPRPPTWFHGACGLGKQSWDGVVILFELLSVCSGSWPLWRALCYCLVPFQQGP